MKKSRYREGQVIQILKQGEVGMPTAKLCREHGISSAAYYNQRARYGGMDTSGDQAAAGAGRREQVAETDVRLTQSEPPDPQRVRWYQLSGSSALYVEGAGIHLKLVPIMIGKSRDLSLRLRRCIQIKHVKDCSLQRTVSESPAGHAVRNGPRQGNSRCPQLGTALGTARWMCL